jgi:HEPN domain-containing protein
MDLVPYEDPETSNSRQDTALPEPATLEEAKKEIAEAMKEIWQLPESERSSAIKRLIRRWHPDKNRHQESFANDVTKFLLEEVERLKKDGRQGYHSHVGNSRQSSRGPSRPSSTWSGPDFSEYFHRYEERARRQRRRHESQDDYEDETEPANTNEAERWMKQAQKDLNLASCILQIEEDTYYSFTCFHCQQAVEKALKALMFAKGHILTSDLEAHGHDVLELAYRASRIDLRLSAIPSMVKVIDGYYGKTRYPDYKRGCVKNSIPAEMFTQEDAHEALSQARESLQLIRQVMD